MFGFIYVQHQSTQGVPTIVINDSMAYGLDNAETLQCTIPPEEWENSVVNGTNLAKEDLGATHGLKGGDSVDSSGVGGDCRNGPSSTPQEPQHVHSEPLPEVPNYKPIIRISKKRRKKRRLRRKVLNPIKEEAKETKAKEKQLPSIAIPRGDRPVRPKLGGLPRLPEHVRILTKNRCSNKRKLPSR